MYNVHLSSISKLNCPQKPYLASIFYVYIYHINLNMYIVKCVSIRLTFASQGLFPIVNPLLTNNTNITDIFIGIKRKQVIIPKYYKSDK